MAPAAASPSRLRSAPRAAASSSHGASPSAPDSVSSSIRCRASAGRPCLSASSASRSVDSSSSPGPCIARPVAGKRKRRETLARKKQSLARSRPRPRPPCPRCPAPHRGGSMTLETLSSARSFGGTQLACRHSSREIGTDMVFGLYLPPQAEAGEPLPVLWYLSGLTCTHANVVEKGQYQRVCAELGLIFVAPDTSPRGADVPDDEAYDFGQGAGFYVDASEQPYAANYRMASYVADEL